MSDPKTDKKMATNDSENVNNSGTLFTVAFKIVKRVNSAPVPSVGTVAYVDDRPSRQQSSAFGNTFIINKRT